eukprot:1303627-Rhodomonas_salina.1
MARGLHCASGSGSGPGGSGSWRWHSGRRRRSQCRPGALAGAGVLATVPGRVLAVAVVAFRPGG